MKCADHPEMEAVAIIYSEYFDSYFGACDSCYRKHKKQISRIKT